MIRRFLPSGLRHSLPSFRFGLVAGSALILAQPAWAAQQTAPVDDDASEPAPTASIPVVQPTAPSPTRALNAALARLAREPRDSTALLDAGGAALELGDTDAAIGFLTRADQVSPGNAGVRARMGVAMLRSIQPFEAIRWFDLAEQAGFNRAEMATERGLAYDLIGDNTSAQREYQLALAAGPNDEARRRYALSLAIAGDRREAEHVIQPLLEKRDRAAWRVRTFIMAIAGQSDEAEGIAKATMPAELAAAISPYLRYMPRLTPAQQAAAANLGRFPRAADIGRDDPQVVQYALAHPRAPRVDAALVPQGEALGGRGRDDRSKRRRPGREDKRETALAAATPAPAPAPVLTPPPPPPPPPALTPTTPAVSAPWGLPPGTRTAAATQQVAAPAQSQSQSQSPASRPTVLSKLDVPPGTPLASLPQPRPAAAAPTAAFSSSPASASVPPVSAPAKVATAAPAAATPSAAAPSTAAPSGPQFALAAAPPSIVAAQAPPPPPPPSAAATVVSPAEFSSMFEGFKPPAQETATTTQAVDLARIEALRESARAAAAAKAKERAKDRGARPDGPTAVSRTSDEDVAEPVVTRAGKEKAAKEKAVKDKAAKEAAAKEKLPLNTDCLEAPAKGKGGKAAKGKGKPAPAKGKSAAKTKGKGAADEQCPPETEKAQKGKKGKAEPAYASRIWVQVLTGSNRQAMGKEWQRLVREAAALKGRKPFISPWRSNYRLLTGPFASDAEAQAFVEKLRGQGVSSYQWTSPAGQPVDGLGVK